MALSPDERLDEHYLGDGVYVSHDGYQVWLRADRDGMQHSIALEPGLPELVAQYDRDIRAKHAARRTLDDGSLDATYAYAMGEAGMIVGPAEDVSTVRKHIPSRPASQSEEA